MTNEDYSKEDIAQAFVKAPANIQAALESEQLLTTLEEIGGKHGLNESQSDALVDETGLLLLGLTPKGQFASSIEGRLGLDSQHAKALASDVILEVFETILGDSTPPSPLPNRNQVLYEDRRCLVTYSTLEVGPTTYPVSKITSVMQPLKMGWLSPTYWVTVEFAGGEELRIERKKQEEVDGIYVALRKALDA